MTLGYRIKQTSHAAASLHWSSPAGKVTLVHVHLQTWKKNTHIHLCPLHIFKYTHARGHPSCSLALFFFTICNFFFFKAGTSILPDDKMVLYSMTTDCLWQKGQCNCDSLYWRTWEALVALMLKFPLWLFYGRDSLIPFIGLAQSQGKMCSRAFRTQKFAFTAITQSSLHPPVTLRRFIVAGAGLCGQIYSLPLCPSARAHLLSHYSANAVSCNVK